MSTSAPVAVIGAYGHTGRFVLAELAQRGLAPVLVGRDAARLAALARDSGAPARVAALDDAEALDRALAGAAAVIHCAGPFAATAATVLEAALRARIAYVDVCAEVEVAAELAGAYAGRVRDAGLCAVPALAFYGGLGDLVTGLAMGDWPAADSLHLAYALSRWHPTAGTRATGRVSQLRRGGRRLHWRDGALAHTDAPAPRGEWTYPAPFGRREVVDDFLSVDPIVISWHRRIADIQTCMTAAALADLADPTPPPPAAVDTAGRSDQRFLLEARVRRGTQERRAWVEGRDIYAISAALAAEGVRRLLDGEVGARGLLGAGAAFAPRAMLEGVGLALHEATGDGSAEARPGRARVVA